MGEEKKAKNEWVHFRELRARCPVCKKVAHVACKNGTYFFVHDAYDPFARHNAVETTEPVFKILFDGFVSVNGREPVKSGNRTLTNEAMMQDMFPRKGKRDNRGCNQPTAKKVRCAETGNQFVSLSDAARAVGLRNGNSIRRAIDRGGTAGGYHWEYLDEKKEVSTDDHHQADGRAE